MPVLARLAFLRRCKLAEEKPPVRLPRTLAACADLYWETRNKRLAIDKQVAELQKQETYIKEHLIKNIPKSDATGVAGKLCRVTVMPKDIPQVKDWDKFWEYIARNRSKGAFALLNKAPNAAAIKEIWESGKDVPGVEKFSTSTLSVNKV